MKVIDNTDEKHSHIETCLFCKSTVAIENDCDIEATGKSCGECEEYKWLCPCCNKWNPAYFYTTEQCWIETKYLAYHYAFIEFCVATDEHLRQQYSQPITQCQGTTSTTYHIKPSPGEQARIARKSLEKELANTSKTKIIHKSKIEQQKLAEKWYNRYCKRKQRT